MTGPSGPDDAAVRVARSTVSGDPRVEPRVPSFGSRLAPSVAVGVAILIQTFLSDPIILAPRWVAPAVESLLLVVLVIGTARERGHRDRLSVIRLLLGGILAASATNSALLLIRSILANRAITANELLSEGVQVLALIIIAYAVLFWQLDGGSDARPGGRPRPRTFLFPQASVKDLLDWQPHFLDYLYVSWTNAAAFSPTDAMPLTRWVKMLMMCQSMVSLATIAVVLARAINALG